MLSFLVETFTKNSQKIEDWFLEVTERVGGDPVYASVDLRNAGYKLAPVDTNIYPAGFNNLCPSYHREATRLFGEYFKKYHPTARKIAIITEEHTRNLYYFENLFHLQNIIREAGYEIELCSLSGDLPHEKNDFETSEGNKIIIWRAGSSSAENGEKLTIEPFTPDLLLINNDFSAGLPPLIKKIIQPMVPTPLAGWHTRRKSHHFYHYEKLAAEFCRLIDIDPWLISAYYSCMGAVDFSDRSRMEELAKKVDIILEKIRIKYEEYGIKKTPYVFVKNDAGTYGMAVMTAESGSEFLHLNKKQRSKMKVGKGSQLVTEVIIQEGLPTIDRFQGVVAEPVIYLVDNKVCGGFFRLHEGGDALGNLNQPGMKFTKMCLHEMKGYGIEYEEKCDLTCLAVMYKHIARIASLSAGFEIKPHASHENY